MASLTPPNCTSLVVPREETTEVYTFIAEVKATQNNGYTFTAKRAGDAISGPMHIQGTFTKVVELNNRLKGDYEYHFKGSDLPPRTGTLSGTFQENEHRWEFEVTGTVYPQTWILQ